MFLHMQLITHAHWLTNNFNHYQLLLYYRWHMRPTRIVFQPLSLFAAFVDFLFQDKISKFECKTARRSTNATVHDREATNVKKCVIMTFFCIRYFRQCTSTITWLKFINQKYQNVISRHLKLIILLYMQTLTGDTRLKISNMSEYFLSVRLHRKSCETAI